MEQLAITRSEPEAAAPDRVALSDWLLDEVERGGRITSWVHPAEPGYDYAEAAALWLSWASWRGLAGTPRAARVARALLAELAGKGALGRGGQRYLFDTCLGLHALVRAGVALPFEELVERLSVFEEPADPVVGGRWSERWTRHMDRAAAFLLQAARRRGSSRGERLAFAIRERAVEDHDYLHALAYAVEGELLFRALGEPPREGPEAFAGQLVELQRDDGALPAWRDGRDGPRLDVTAQAVRIWLALDRERFARPVRRALGALSRAQHEGGGVIYDPRGHVNTWTSIFADQAAAWAEQGADPSAWI